MVAKAWPWTSAAEGPGPKKYDPAATTAHSGTAPSSKGLTADATYLNTHTAPVYTPPNERWTLHAAAWQAARTRRASAAAKPPTGALSTVNLGRDEVQADQALSVLARDEAVQVEGLAAPELCETVAAEVAGIRTTDSVALVSAASHCLLAHSIVMEVCDAVLGCQSMRMMPPELAERMCLPGNFTGQRQLVQMPWELNFVRADGNVHPEPNPPPELPVLRALDLQLLVIWRLSGDTDVDGVDEVVGHLAGAPVRLPRAGSALITLGSGTRRWKPTAQGSLLAVSYQLGFLQPAENHYLKACPQDVAKLPMHMQRLLGFHLPGQILNKYYAGPGEHDILGAAQALGHHPIDWATHLPVPRDRAEVDTIRRPAVFENHAEYLPVSPSSADLGSLSLLDAPSSVEQAVSDLESLYARWNCGRCDEVLGQHSSLIDDQQPSMQITSIEWPELLKEVGLSGVVEMMLAALQRDGCVVLSSAVSTAVCDAIEAEIAPYKWRSRLDGRTEGITGSLLSRSRFVQYMAAHPAVVAAVEAVLGRQVLYPELMKQISNSAARSGSSEGRLPWRVHVDITIPKDAHQPAQQLHRDGDLSLLDFANEMEHAVSVIWYASFHVRITGTDQQ
jgi:hypothetical protein